MSSVCKAPGTLYFAGTCSPAEPADCVRQWRAFCPHSTWPPSDLTPICFPIAQREADAYDGLSLQLRLVVSSAMIFCEAA